MKKIATYLFLTLYVSVLLRPAIPFIAYNLQYEYIVEVLCINRASPELNCNGSCYLTKDIQKTQLADSEEGQITLSILDLGNFPLAFQDTKPYLPILLKPYKAPDYFAYTIGKTSSYSNEIVHPPEFLVFA